MHFQKKVKSALLHENQNYEGGVESDSLVAQLEGSLSSSLGYFEEEETEVQKCKSQAGLGLELDSPVLQDFLVI